MIDPQDMDHCRAAIRQGSLSFHAASRLLPRKVRDPALALYAFCRLADDAVDDHDDKTGAVLRLRDRLDRVYAGRPINAAADRAFAATVEQYQMPRALPDALLEGFAWDATERQYHTLSDVRAYSARVASAVGVMMSVLMEVRNADALARAADLGVAMQLTNIARDVGEDARAGRLYVPLDWFAELGVDADAFLANPTPTDAIRTMTKRLLVEARGLYASAEAGITALPLQARPGIFAARYVYAGIGGTIARAGFDSVTRRAVTSKSQKMGWLAQSLWQTGVGLVLPQSAVLHRAALPETQFLVDAAARSTATRWGSDRSGTLLSILAHLEQRDRDGRLKGSH